MGRGMAENLIAAGHRVSVFNRTVDKTQPLQRRGAAVAKTPADAVRDAEVIISMVTNDAASRAVWIEDGGALSGIPASNALAIESSTVSRNWVLQLAAATKAKGLRFLDCPVAGRPDAAASGQLMVFGGGDKKDLLAASSVLSAIAKSVTHFGPVGSGMTFKLIYNALGAVQVAALAEAMAMCFAAKLDLSAAAEVFAAGATGSPHVRRHAPGMALHRYEQPVQFAASGRVKDLTYALDLAVELRRAAALSEAARSTFQKMIDLEGGELNDIELFEFLCR